MRLTALNNVSREASKLLKNQPTSARERNEELSLTLDELTLPDVLLMLKSLEYSRMNITHGTAPYEIKQQKLNHLEAVMAKLRALRDDMLTNP
jgi:hypothetical protein